MNTIVRNVHNVPAEASALRQQVREHVASLQKALAEVETRWMQLADAVYEIQLKGYWRLYSDSKGASYPSFDAWIDAECTVKHSTVFSVLRVRRTLDGKLDRNTIERLGRSRCYELVKVAESKPRELQPLVDKVLSSEWTCQQTKQAVANVVRGFHYDDGGFKILEFHIPAADVETVEQAILVGQATEPCQNPDSEAARGIHLVSICQEFLLDPNNSDVLKQFRQARQSMQKCEFAVED
jgi:hypothetical protein